MNNECGLTILHQLGGLGRLAAMVGANNVALLPDGVRFKFKGSRVANCLEVKLNAWDLYDVTFYRLSNKHTEWVVVSETSDAYADMLIDLFEDVTGLALTLSARAVV